MLTLLRDESVRSPRAASATNQASVDLCAYRIIQEALNDTLKHAAPSIVEVSSGYRSDAVQVSVADDGRGDIRPTDTR